MKGKQKMDGIMDKVKIFLLMIIADEIVSSIFIEYVFCIDR